MSTIFDTTILPEREESFPLQEQFDGPRQGGEERPASEVFLARAAEGQTIVPAPVFIP